MPIPLERYIPPGKFRGLQQHLAREQQKSEAEEITQNLWQILMVFLHPERKITYGSTENYIRLVLTFLAFEGLQEETCEWLAAYLMSGEMGIVEAHHIPNRPQDTLARDLLIHANGGSIIHTNKQGGTIQLDSAKNGLLVMEYCQKYYVIVLDFSTPYGFRRIEITAMVYRNFLKLKPGNPTLIVNYKKP